MGVGRGVWNFLFADQRIVFLSLPLSNSLCFRHPVRSQRGKVQKVAKNMRWKCSLASCIAGYAPPLSVDTVLCTDKRDFATVIRYGGIGFYNNRGEEPNFSIFPESLGPKGSDWCSFQVDGPPQAIFEPRRVRVTLIPGSTLVKPLKYGFFCPVCSIKDSCGCHAHPWYRRAGCTSNRVRLENAGVNTSMVRHCFRPPCNSRWRDRFMWSDHGN